MAAIGSGDVVVDNGQGTLRRPDLAMAQAQAFEGLRAGDFVHQVPVDINERCAVGVIGDQMVVPDFVVKRAAFAHLNTRVQEGLIRGPF